MFRTIQSKLFFTYSIFILVIIGAFTTFYYVHASKSIEEKASESLYTMAYSLNAQLDSELSSMNSMITKIWYSETFKTLFFSDIDSDSSEGLENQRMLKESVLTALGPDFPINRVTIFQPDGNLFSVGLLQPQVKFTKEQILELKWVRRAQSSGKKAVVIPPHPDDWMMSGSPVVSLSKSVDTYGKQASAVIEMQQDYAKFVSIIDHMISSGDAKKHSKSVVIYDSEGEVIYPYEESPSAEVMEKIKRYRQESDHIRDLSVTVRITDPVSKEREVAAFHQSEFSGWTIAIAEPENVLLAPVAQLRNTTLLASAIILFATLVLSYFVSKTFTIPINKILKNMKRLSLEALPEKAFRVDSNINELEELNQSFSDMCVKLKDSLDEIVSTRSHEIQSRLLALQAQMNPHFLYNTIANISVMAEDNQDMEVVDACRNLSHMLRFISSKSQTPIHMKEELAHTECFIQLMKIRHEDALSLTVDLPDEMMDIQIPKLVIQPLVENCTKYAIHLDPPWEIKIAGELVDHGWRVRVTDNGPGFSEETLASLKSRLQGIDLKNPLLNLSVGGMGLINIYVRLKLLYGSATVFELYNLPGGGAAVEVGGSVLEQKEEISLA